MKNFKEYINEKLKLSLARQYMKQSSGKHKELLDHIFKGKDRLYYPIEISIDDLKDAQFPISDDDDSYKDKKNFLVVISRHPYDIASMDVGRSWEDDMKSQYDYDYDKDEPATPETFGHPLLTSHIAKDIEHGTLISYLISPNDKNIENPYSRILLKPYINTENPQDVSYNAGDIFGKYYIVPFQKFIDQWINKNLNVGKKGAYRIPSDVYKGESDKLDLTIDMTAEDLLEKYPPDQFGVVHIPHGINWSNNPELTELPFKDKNIKVIIMGDFDVSHCNLTSLKGSPHEVKGDFFCGWNKLTSLEDGPKIVGGKYHCYGNPIENISQVINKLNQKREPLEDYEGHAPEADLDFDYYTKNRRRY